MTKLINLRGNQASDRGRNQHTYTFKTDPLVGKRFGKLNVLNRLPKRKSGAKNTRSRVLCQCSCGNRVIVPRAYLLRKPNPKQDCGKCGKRIVTAYSHNPEYKVWVQMKHRCNNPKHVSYKAYGGRGVKVCNRWMESFENFFSDMGPRLTPWHSLDRINPEGNYEVSNCRWATSKEQAANKRKVEHKGKMVRHPQHGKLIPAAELARELGISYQQLRKRMVDDEEW